MTNINPNINANTNPNLVINEYKSKEFNPKKFNAINYNSEKEYYKTPEKSPYTLSDVKKAVKKYKTYTEDNSKGITKEELDLEIEQIINWLTIYKLTKFHNATILVTENYIKIEKENIRKSITNRYESFFILPNKEPNQKPKFDFINWNKTFQAL